ncbi:hypothetical protein GGTG_06644 [Gaeumannomyces tritici R3-111a-1]|uniref:Uncharacterized protein n=1 Tax=Gaeumannomyces tritici (strain R3-111a-1) TaxID=644352 RepID=J3NZE5_GAET3|nr:hypothetical protein GGTG_06644 [Gaeumannomyces tritici R3-111a-1]EJT76728.1 hypothetical protein GGTG_06644 [Gaeumannomyces tritici R3-111a-1]
MGAAKDMERPLRVEAALAAGFEPPFRPRSNDDGGPAGNPTLMALLARPEEGDVNKCGSPLPGIRRFAAHDAAHLACGTWGRGMLLRMLQLEAQASRSLAAAYTMQNPSSNISTAAAASFQLVADLELSGGLSPCWSIPKSSGLGNPSMQDAGQRPTFAPDKKI